MEVKLGSDCSGRSCRRRPKVEDDGTGGVAGLGEDGFDDVRVGLDVAERMEHSGGLPCGQRARAPRAQAFDNGGRRREERNETRGEMPLGNG